MAVYEYFYDCPECDQSESCSVVVHVRHGESDAEEPEQRCECALTQATKDYLMDRALDEAEEDTWDGMWDCTTDREVDRWLDQLEDE